MPKFSQRSKDNLKGVHPDLALVMETAIVDTPVDFTVVEGLRSDERQAALFAQGRTKPGPKVTNADGKKNLSNHQDAADGKKDGKGSAVDIYPFVDGQVRVNEKYVIGYLKQITDHIKKVAKALGIEIECGIDWKNPYDPPHVQLKRKK